jgi:hypothetical protein
MAPKIERFLLVVKGSLQATLKVLGAGRREMAQLSITYNEKLGLNP